MVQTNVGAGLKPTGEQGNKPQWLIPCALLEFTPGTSGQARGLYGPLPLPEEVVLW